MLRFAHAYIPDRVEAENIVQDTFIYLFEHRSLLLEVHSPQAYLFVLIKHRCIDFLRKKIRLQQRRMDISKEGEYYEYKYKLYSLEVFDERKCTEEELYRRLHEAIDRLPEQCRRIFIRSKIEHQKYRIIAEEMGLSEQTVKNQVIIALHKLREELKDLLPIMIFFIG